VFPGNITERFMLAEVRHPPNFNQFLGIIAAMCVSIAEEF
jgi:hypothetical protein